MNSNANRHHIIVNPQKTDGFSVKSRLTWAAHASPVRLTEPRTNTTLRHGSNVDVCPWPDYSKGRMNEREEDI
jgi:hypothetical protein